MGGDGIQRHRTAIRRGDFSRPVKAILRDALLGDGVTFFDYGCGRGEDVELLTARSISCGCWDPAYRPESPRVEADIVNLGYVINVIENPEERAATVREAWQLARQLLVVSAQVLVAGRGKAPVEFGDGVLTCRGTFQKFFEQDELKAFIEAQLQTEAIPAGIGVFYAFKDEGRRQQFLANRFRRREVLPRRRVADTQYQENRELLETLMAAVASFGRLPEAYEFPRSQEVAERFGSIKRAFAVIRHVTGGDEWEQIAKRRSEDMLVYLALARFRGRPAISLLPRTLQLDIRAFFGAYTKACSQADELLFQAGKAELIDAACKRSAIGKLLPDALYIHRESLDYLEPVLRVYEGCGRAYLGEIEGANIVKIHRYSGKVSYLIYPDFEKNPHPALVRSVKLCMRTRQLDCHEFGQGGNPPILHRKESFLHADHPLREKFAKLTAQEEKAGLLEDTATIGALEGWKTRLAFDKSEAAGKEKQARDEMRSRETIAGIHYSPDARLANIEQAIITRAAVENWPQTKLTAALNDARSAHYAAQQAVPRPGTNSTAGQPPTHPLLNQLAAITGGAGAAPHPAGGGSLADPVDPRTGLRQSELKLVNQKTGEIEPLLKPGEGGAISRSNLEAALDRLAAGNMSAAAENQLFGQLIPRVADPKQLGDLLGRID